MSLPCRRLAAALLAIGLHGAAWGQAGAAAYEVSVWARVLFGSDGRAQTVTMIEAPGLSPQFVQAARARIEKARIEPRLAAGVPATLRTGVRMNFELTPTAQGATVRVLGLEMMPLPLQRAMAAYPQDVARSEGWTGALVGACTVQPEGRCADISVRSNLVMPETARRFVKESLALWRFEPQELAGQPVAAEFWTEFALKTEPGAPEDFRLDKFERVTKGR